MSTDLHRDTVLQSVSATVEIFAHDLMEARGAIIKEAPDYPAVCSHLVTMSLRLTALRHRLPDATLSELIQIGRETYRARVRLRVAFRSGNEVCRPGGVDL